MLFFKRKPKYTQCFDDSTEKNDHFDAEVEKLAQSYEYLKRSGAITLVDEYHKLRAILLIKEFKRSSKDLERRVGRVYPNHKTEAESNKTEDNY